MAFNKVFFHGSGNGIGDMLRAVSGAGIPFVMKSLNNEGFVLEAYDIVKQDGIPHTLIYRNTDPTGTGNDIPNLDIPPELSAAGFWKGVKAAIPQGIKDIREHVWIEPTNEISTKPDDHPGPRWVGDFCYQLATEAVADGYKVLIAGFNAGQPEPLDWSTHFGLFLRYACERPHQVGISVHEGFGGKVDYKKDPPFHPQNFPWITGRFESIHEAADAMNLPRPTIVMSEWAWSYNAIPSSVKVVADVKWLSAYLAEFPNVLGACLWNLHDIPALANYIPWIRDYTIQTVHPDPVPPIVDPPDPPKTLDGAMWDISVDTQLIRLRKPPTAIQSAAAKDGFQVVGNEDGITWEGQAWRFQAAEQLTHKLPRRVYRVKVPAEGQPWPAPEWFEDPENAPDPPPIPGEQYDIADYLVPPGGQPFGDILIMLNNWGQGQERVQLQAVASMAYVTKNQQWERRRIGTDYIYLEMDTSPGNNEYYTSTGPEFPRIWAPGWGTYNKQNTITFRRKSDCVVVNTYTEITKLRFVAHLDEITLPSGIKVKDVIKIAWDSSVTDNDEIRYFARGLGLVWWIKYDGRASYVVEIIPQGDQQNNVRELIPCQK